jgi:hypothetical protein
MYIGAHTIKYGMYINGRVREKKNNVANEFPKGAKTTANNE